MRLARIAAAMRTRCGNAASLQKPASSSLAAVGTARGDNNSVIIRVRNFRCIRLEPIRGACASAMGVAFRYQEKTMMRSMLVVFATISILSPAPAFAAEPALVVKESKLGVKETIDALAAALEAKGVKVAARIDHAAGAKMAGMELRPAEVIIFGNPKLGTPLMQADQRAGLDLPMKVLAWQDAGGKVFVTYTDPAALKTRYGLEGKDDVLKAMAQALDAFSNAATGK